MKDNLSLQLQTNNSVVIKAELNVAVHAKTWIWKGASILEAQKEKKLNFCFSTLRFVKERA